MQSNGNRVDERADARDERAGDRKGPAGTRQVMSLDRSDVGNGQPRAERRADRHVGGETIEPCAARVHSLPFALCIAVPDIGEFATYAPRNRGIDASTTRGKPKLRTVPLSPTWLR